MSHLKLRDRNKPRRAQRQSEAKVRQEVYNTLTLEQKVDGLKGLTASKQRARLARAIFARNQKAVRAAVASVDAAHEKKVAQDRADGQPKKVARNDKKAQKRAAKVQA